MIEKTKQYSAFTYQTTVENAWVYIFFLDKKPCFSPPPQTYSSVWLCDYGLNLTWMVCFLECINQPIRAKYAPLLLWRLFLPQLLYVLLPLDTPLRAVVKDSSGVGLLSWSTCGVWMRLFPETTHLWNSSRAKLGSHDPVPLLAVTILCYSRLSRSLATLGSHDPVPLSALTILCHSRL